MSLKCILAAPLVLLSLSGTAWSASESQPADDTSNLLRDTALLSRNDVNLSGERFLNAWLSKTDERERIKANMYLLGVMDATEGKAWCSYKLALPGSLREGLFDYMNKLSSERKKERASVLITEALAKDLPCGETKSK
ncbi:Rap1a/Tai family immunity protein [Pseudescherichia vulneris]|uniref:Rap1a/Tai family immunity protein n=1 Tax=Pseudescherichia vulneris TaxID=566 RepID=UPI0030CA055D